MTIATPNQPIHPSFDERVSVKVENQLPQFVKQDHPTFVAFLEAYYEYMEQQGKPYEIIGNLNNYADLGKTTDDFLKYFKQQFGKDIPEVIFQNANKPFVLKRLRDFYRAKGSEKSFQFFFRLLYNEEIELYYPGQDMLRASDGKYDKSQIIRAVDTSGQDKIFDLVGKTITGSISTATAVVESVLNESVGSFVVSTIYLSGTKGTFVDEIISDGTNSFQLGAMIVDTNITTAGNNYSIGDIIPSTGGGGSGVTIKVKELTAGHIKSVAITSGGSGYTVGDKLTVNNGSGLDINGRTASLLVKTVDGSGAITAVTLENQGRGYTSLPTISGGSGTGATFTLTGWGVGGIAKLQIANNGFGFETAPTLNFTTKGDGTAQGTSSIGFYEPNFNVGFSGEGGFLSSSKYLQDSKYYQLFSYVVSSTETIDKWRNYVKRVIHPAGMALFGKLQIVSNIKTSFKITGIPQRREYTIIFHDGSIIPPVTLQVKVDACTDDFVWVYAAEDYSTITTATSSTQDDGLITQAVDSGEDHGLITQESAAHTLPTKCQIYQQYLGLQKFVDGGYDDYLFVTTAATRAGDFGQVSNTGTSLVDYGTIIEAQTSESSQLRLGPLRRSFERHKFKKQGGFSQKIGTGTQSGMTIYDFKDIQISEYVFFYGKRHNKITNATITQYATGDESNSLPPS